MMLFAVHISDGLLTWDWLLGGFLGAAALICFSLFRLHEDMVPRIAILTSAFFVSSLIHVRAGPTSIHLLMTGLVGVTLGFRSGLAIFVGLLLQVLLFQHGGFTTLGINTCIMTAPALLCYLLFQAMHRIPWMTSPLARPMLVGSGALIWYFSAVYSIALVCQTSLASIDESAFQLANVWLLNPWLLGGGLLFTMVMIVVERRLEHTPEFPLGFLIGELSVLLTAALNCAVLIAGGEEHWPTPPLLLVVAHLPIAVVEGVILGFTVGYLARVKPEMLGIRRISPLSPGTPGERGRG
jgi:cobalt/nickel transport system permease protein